MTAATLLEVTFLSQDFEYIPELGVSGYVRIELVRSYQNIDGETNREYFYQRHSWADATSGSFDFLRQLPLGLATVSGA